MISPLQNDRYHVYEAFEEAWLKELEDLGHIAVMERLRQENLISQYWDKKCTSRLLGFSICTTLFVGSTSDG